MDANDGVKKGVTNGLRKSERGTGIGWKFLCKLKNRNFALFESSGVFIGLRITGSPKWLGKLEIFKNLLTSPAAVFLGVEYQNSGFQQNWLERDKHGCWGGKAKGLILGATKG